MRKLVLHHQYRMGMAWDISGFDNHGRTQQVVAGAGAHEGSLRFAHPGSRVDVTRAPSLDPSGAFRCSVLFDLSGPPTRRYNLVESHLSFAFFVEKGYRLMATIVDATGAWNGVMTPLQIDPFYGGGLSGWHRADCGHDGISTIWIAVNGRVVAVRDDVPGPVRPVGPNGISIGHWPEPQDRYTFEGHLAETWLWMDRPDPPVDGCCVEREALARADEILRAKGWGVREARDMLTRLAVAGGEVRASLDSAARPDYDRTAARLRAALHAQNWQEVGRQSAHARHMAEAAMPEADRERLARDVVDAMGDLLTDRALVEAALGALLFDKTPPGDRGEDDEDRCRDWTHWGLERDPREDEVPEPKDGEDEGVPPDVGYPPAKKPRRREKPQRPEGST